MFKRYVLTGTPGCGKTTLLGALRQRGHAVVDEAATEVIARLQHLGCDEPWARDDFIDLIVDLQQERQRAPAPAGVEVQLFDRSPLCTLALARYLDRDVPPALTREVDRMLREHFYQRDVLCLRPLGFITATSARRISYSDSLIFHQVHEEVYREYGFTLVNVAVCGVADRVAIVENQLTTQP